MSYARNTAKKRLAPVAWQAIWIILFTFKRSLRVSRGLPHTGFTNHLK